MVGQKTIHYTFFTQSEILYNMSNQRTVYTINLELNSIVDIYSKVAVASPNR